MNKANYTKFTLSELERVRTIVNGVVKPLGLTTRVFYIGPRPTEWIEATDPSNRKHYKPASTRKENATSAKIAIYKRKTVKSNYGTFKVMDLKGYVKI